MPGCFGDVGYLAGVCGFPRSPTLLPKLAYCLAGDTCSTQWPYLT